MYKVVVLWMVWYICLVSSMVAGIEGEGGEGSKCESMERIYFLNSSVNIV
jgi:hypothetical protein